MHRIAPMVLAIWVGRALSALLATVLVLWILRRLGAILHAAIAAIETRMNHRGRGIAFRSIEILSADSILRFLRSAIGVTRAAVSFTVLYVWVLAVAWSLDASHRVIDAVWRPFVAAISAFWTALIAFVPNVVTISVIVFLARFATRSVDIFTEAIAEERVHVPGLDAELATPTRRLTNLIIWLIALVMAVPYLPGSDSRAFQGIAIMIGVVLSLGSSSVISNLLAGLVLTYTRAYRVGDRVKIGDVVGDVIALGAFSTRIRTIKDEEVVIPNSVVQAGAVQNFSRFAPDPGVQVSTQVTIGYDAPWRSVHRLLIAAANTTRGVRPFPQPYVLQRALDEFYVRYELCVYSDQPRTLHIVEAELRQSIQDEFFREGFEICSPHYQSFRDGHRPAIPPEMRHTPIPEESSRSVIGPSMVASAPPPPPPPPRPSGAPVPRTHGSLMPSPLIPKRHSQRPPSIAPMSPSRAPEASPIAESVEQQLSPVPVNSTPPAHAPSHSPPRPPPLVRPAQKKE